MGALGASELDHYRDHGFVRVEEAVPREVALRCQQAIWEQLPEDPGDPGSWTRPVARLMVLTPELAEAARAPRLLDAIHAVAGAEATPVGSLGGSVVVRFPVEGDPGDDGWHIDGSYPGPDGGFWVNHRSRGRALVLLVLLSEVGPDDAPTRIRSGSHLTVADALREHGEEGVNALQFQPPAEVHDRPLELATGEPGDVYLCHPFLAHAAQANCGTRPRFLTQPPVLGPDWIQPE